MNVINIDPKAKQRDERKTAMLEILEEMKLQVEQGKIEEFVACSLDKDGECQIHAYSLDLPGGVGLFEIGKHMLITAESLA